MDLPCRWTKDTEGLILVRLRKELAKASMQWVTDKRILELGQYGWVGGVGRWISERWVSFPTSNSCIITIDNFGWLRNLVFFFSYTVLPFLLAIIADGRACWCLGRVEPSCWGEGFWVLCPNMTLMDSDKFLSLGGSSPRLEIFPGQQETSETLRSQMGCCASLISRSWWARAKRVWGRQRWGSASKDISITIGVPQFRERGHGSQAYC